MTNYGEVCKDDPACTCYFVSKKPQTYLEILRDLEFDNKTINRKRDQFEYFRGIIENLVHSFMNSNELEEMNGMEKKAYRLALKLEIKSIFNKINID
jgi:hypothetical protein